MYDNAQVLVPDHLEGVIGKAYERPAFCAVTGKISLDDNIAPDGAAFNLA